jgi:hypothetical protein
MLDKLSVSFSILLYVILCLFRYEECKEKLIPFLKKVGFNPKTGLTSTTYVRGGRGAWGSKELDCSWEILDFMQ